IINDISGGGPDMLMYDLVAEKSVAYILMHMQGTPKDMQHRPVYSNVIDDITEWFNSRIVELKQREVTDIIIDPGFGFGKTVDQNYQMLNNLECFKDIGFPVLAGLSRKSMIWKRLDITPEESLNATTALNMIALNNGASILRVHDVKDAVETVKLHLSLRS
ncbi:MAG: dihydropteroate synthase, partial [Bacteroidales bacterium]|nr:dihydropteroate synthase [Bacteroidales bacterium]